MRRRMSYDGHAILLLRLRTRKNCNGAPSVDNLDVQTNDRTRRTMASPFFFPSCLMIFTLARSSSISLGMHLMEHRANFSMSIMGRFSIWRMGRRRGAHWYYRYWLSVEEEEDLQQRSSFGKRLSMCASGCIDNEVVN